MTAVKELQVPWLLAPVWKDFPMSKGLNHHRIPVGIILTPDESITFTIVSEDLEKVRVRFCNNDSLTEGKICIDTSLPQRSAATRVGSVSVPFIDAEYVDRIPSQNRTVRVQYPSRLKLLPVYHYGDDEDSFFDLWDVQEAEFAYIESNYFGLLVPQVDKEHARNLPNGHHLDDLILFFDEIFTIYHRLIGLSFEDSGTDRNVRNRFFIKADAHGVGAAYYCDECTAESTASVKKFWMDLSPTNWGALHELGHGHELKNLSDETFSILEVWNNVLVVFYQYTLMGDEVRTKGGLSRRSTEIDRELRTGTPVKGWGLFQKLSFLIHMFIRAGEKSFIRFNQLTRREWANESLHGSGSSILEKLMQLFAIDFGLDMFPFMRLAKATIANEHLLEHYYTLSEVAYPLNFLVEDEELLGSIRRKLRLWYDTSLVTPLDLRQTNLKGDFTLEIEDELYRILFGEMFKLMDGSRTLVEKRILQRTIKLTSIPVGVYKIFIPSGPRNNMFIYEDVYAVIRPNSTVTLRLQAKTLTASSLMRDRIIFLGLEDEPFASLTADPIRKVVIFNVFFDNPHSYFSGRVYASVEIRNSENDIVFKKVVEGVHAPVGVYEVPMRETLHVTIFHAETKNRLKTEDPLMDCILNHESNTNMLLVTKFGFQSKLTSKSALAKRLLRRIDGLAHRIRSVSFLYEKPYCHPKYNLSLAIEAFKLLFKNHSLGLNLEEQYKDCLPPNSSSKLVEALVNRIREPTHKSSKDVFYELTHTKLRKKLLIPNRKTFLSSKLKFLGYSDEHVASLYIDTSKQTVVFHVLAPNPHYYYDGEDYFSVTVRNSDDVVVFRRVVQGTGATVEELEVPFTEQISVEVFHAETSKRLVTSNPIVSHMIDRDSKINTFSVCKLENSFKKSNLLQVSRLARSLEHL